MCLGRQHQHSALRAAGDRLSRDGHTPTYAAPPIIDAIDFSHCTFVDFHLWMIGRQDGASAKFRQVGDVNSNIFFAADRPPAGNDMPSSVFPRAIGSGTVTDQFIRYAPHAARLHLEARGLCPSCAGRRMAHMAAHLVAQVLPWVPIRPWIVSGPMSLRDGMMPSRALTAKVPTISATPLGSMMCLKRCRMESRGPLSSPARCRFDSALAVASI